MKTDDIITGCSSFNESDWKGIFYPEDLPRKDWFAFYCRHFNTYEMNGSFYKFPTAKSMQSWYGKAPEGFLFSVKMYKGVTHFKKFNDCEREIAEFYAAASMLKEKLACVLFQLPPSFFFTDERLALVLSNLDYSVKNVIEFRHESWWCETVFEALKKKDVVFCSVSYPDLPDVVINTSQTGYVRFHGVPKLFFSGYDAAVLQRWHDKILRQNWDKAFVYFNNTASTAGIENALQFK